MTNPLATVTGEVPLIQAGPQLVKAAQQRLNAHGFCLAEDGIPGTRTVAAFRSFKTLNYLGSVDILGPTVARKLLEEPAFKRTLVNDDYKEAANLLRVEVAVIRAIVEVETSGGGFFEDGRPKILFEAHIFDGFTDGKYRKSYPNISSAKWNRSLYKGGTGEYDRLWAAQKLDNSAALKSASWGLGQIMGMNHSACGYANVEKFVEAMHKSEGLQLMAMCSFIKTNNLDDELRQHRWADFARAYNGPSFLANNYHTRLADAYKKHLAASL